MTVSHEVGSLQASRWAGSAPAAYAAAKITSGTLTRARKPALAIGSLPLAGKVIGSLYAPPLTYPRDVNVTIRLTATSADARGALAQASVGTLSTCAATGLSGLRVSRLQGLVVPGQGSYVVRNAGNAAILAWTEDELRY